MTNRNIALRQMFYMIGSNPGEFTISDLLTHYVTSCYRSKERGTRQCINGKAYIKRKLIQLVEEGILNLVDRKFFHGNLDILESKSGTAQGNIVCVLDNKDNLIFGRRHKYTESIVTDQNGRHFMEVQIHPKKQIYRYVPEDSLSD